MKIRLIKVDEGFVYWKVQKRDYHFLDIFGLFPFWVDMIPKNFTSPNFIEKWEAERYFEALKFQTKRKRITVEDEYDSTGIDLPSRP